MTVLAIDPGSEQSAWVLWDGVVVHKHGKWPNEELLPHLALDSDIDHVVLEQIASYGKPVGADVFETVWWTGRFCERIPASRGWTRMPRAKVKQHICHSVVARDSYIRQALIDRFGGKEKAIGKKASPGPLYGIKADCWQALALAITWVDLHGGTPTEE
jgi:hypothetical protein